MVMKRRFTGPVLLALLVGIVVAQDTPSHQLQQSPTNTTSHGELQAARKSADESFDFHTENSESRHSRVSAPIVLSPQSPRLDRVLTSNDLQSVPDDYLIGEEDVLTVTVWKERELSGPVTVRPDGKITVPLVGELKVTGMTPIGLQNSLTEKLKPFVTVPQVSVAVNQINSRKVYLIGQVAKEGTFPINTPMTVLQVIAQAGGLRDFAKRKHIYILRKQGEKEIRYPFNFDAVIRGRSTEQNIRLEPGDTVMVP